MSDETKPIMGQITFGPIPTTNVAASGNLSNPPDLIALLERARARGPLTPKEIYEQKISWIRGMSGKLSDPMPTREQAVAALLAMGIVDPEPDVPHDISHIPEER